jgi:hypothetical protein
MAVWEFAVAYLGAFLLLQFVVYRYLRPGDDDEGSAAPAGGAPPESSRAEDPANLPDGVDVGDLPARDDDGPGTRSCPNCGADNEAVGTYTHCWRCAEPL